MNRPGDPLPDPGRGTDRGPSDRSRSEQPPAGPGPKERGSPMRVVSVNLSSEKGTVKRPHGEGTIDAFGLAGDAHAGVWHRQVSLLGAETIARFAAEMGRAIAPGEFAENLTVAGLEAGDCAIFDRIRAGEAELEVTQIGKECHGDACAIFRETGACVMPRAGIFARVVRPGRIRAGDPVELRPRALRCLVVTLSDRAADGAYEDLSGPRLAGLLEEFLRTSKFRPRIERSLLPDDPEALRSELAAHLAAGCDLIFTTGGTGIGPRDRTPEVVSGLCDRLIPGVMEYIRVRAGRENPHALLSRSVAGAAGTCLLFALPGSPRAVEEYLEEIFRHLEHMIRTVRGLGH